MDSLNAGFGHSNANKRSIADRWFVRSAAVPLGCNEVAVYPSPVARPLIAVKMHRLLTHRDVVERTLFRRYVNRFIFLQNKHLVPTFVEIATLYYSLMVPHYNHTVDGFVLNDERKKAIGLTVALDLGHMDMA